MYQLLLTNDVWCNLKHCWRLTVIIRNIPHQSHATFFSYVSVIQNHPPTPLRNSKFLALTPTHPLPLHNIRMAPYKTLKEGSKTFPDWTFLNMALHIVVVVPKKNDKITHFIWKLNCLGNRSKLEQILSSTPFGLL